MQSLIKNSAFLFSQFIKLSRMDGKLDKVAKL